MNTGRGRTSVRRSLCRRWAVISLRYDPRLAPGDIRPHHSTHRRDSRVAAPTMILGQSLAVNLRMASS